MMKNSRSSQHVKDSSPKKVRTLWLGALIAAGVFLRLFNLDAQSLWQDEALQFFIAKADTFSLVIQRAFSGANPPLSHLINHIFFKAAESDFTLRLPSALFGIASLPVFYLVSKKIVSTRAALFALLVFTFSPFHIWYSQEARPYAQLLFFGLLSTHLLFIAIERKRIIWWVGYGLSMFAGLASQVFMGFMLMAHFLWVMMYHRQRLTAYTAAAAGAMMPFIGLIPFYFHSYRVSIGSMGRPGFSLTELGYTFFTYAGGFSIGPNIADLHADRSIRMLEPFWSSIAIVALVFGGLLLFGLIFLSKKNEGQWLVLCLLGLCIPIAGAALYALGIRYNVRYTITGFPFFCIIVGCGLAHLFQKHRYLWMILIIGFTGITTFSLYNYYQNPYYEKENVRDAVAFWRNEHDQVPLLSNQDFAVKRYLDEAERERFIPIKKYSDLITTINDFFNSPENISAYVVLARDWGQIQENQIRQRYRVVSEQRLTGVIVLHLTHTPKDQGVYSIKMDGTIAGDGEKSV